jgi:hypothetical protein
MAFAHWPWCSSFHLLHLLHMQRCTCTLLPTLRTASGPTCWKQAYLRDEAPQPLLAAKQRCTLAPAVAASNTDGRGPGVAALAGCCHVMCCCWLALRCCRDGDEAVLERAACASWPADRCDVDGASGVAGHVPLCYMPPAGLMEASGGSSTSASACRTCDDVAALASAGAGFRGNMITHS